MKILLLLICFPFVGFGQVYSTNSFKISPLRFFNLRQPGLSFDYERKTNDLWASQLSAGFVHSIVSDLGYRNQKGFSFGLEERRYSDAFDGSYLALSVNYYQYQSNMSSLFYYAALDTFPKTYRDEFKIAKQEVQFLFRYGKKMPLIADKLSLETSLGFGIAYRYVVRTELLDPENNEQTSLSNLPRVKGVDDGQKWTFRANINIRLSYDFY